MRNIIQFRIYRGEDQYVVEGIDIVISSVQEISDIDEELARFSLDISPGIYPRVIDCVVSDLIRIHLDTGVDSP